MNILKLFSCLFVALCLSTYAQPPVIAEALSQPVCSDSAPLGELRFTGLSQPDVDSLWITLFRTDYFYAHYSSPASFDMTAWVPPGFWQVSKRFWIDGMSTDTSHLFWSDIVEMESCEPMTASLTMAEDTNCFDEEALLQIKATSDQGMYLSGTLLRDGLGYMYFESPSTTPGVIEAIVSVPAGVYQFYVHEIYRDTIYDTFTTDIVELVPCFSTSINVLAAFEGLLTYDVYDIRGVMIESGNRYDIHQPVNLSHLPSGTYVIRVMHGPDVVRTERRGVVSF